MCTADELDLPADTDPTGSGFLQAEMGAYPPWPAHTPSSACVLEQVAGPGCRNVQRKDLALYFPQN